MTNLNYKSTSTSVEDYLKAIWLTAKDKVASTNALAKQLGIAAPSVSAMLGKLQSSGFVEHERYKGVRLTETGSRQALRLLRRHRLIETFLLEHLNYTWDEIHEEAEMLEHAVSDRFTQRLASFLGHPTHDPHGDPIPNTDGTLPNTPNTPLSEVKIKQTFKVARLMSQTTEVLTYLADLGIEPGTLLEVTRIEPIGGLVHINLKGKKEVLSKGLATLLQGEVVYEA